jgi:uncharacterized Zn-binding protein involved in type VI secretion
MTHSRVTMQGRQMGKSAARLAELGRLRLENAGLVDMNLSKIRDDMCKTCACKLGSVPNGCEQTQLDFLKAAVEGHPFLCHSPHDGSLCAGWVRARAELVANPPPAELVKIISKVEYSPPDAA